MATYRGLSDPYQKRERYQPPTNTYNEEDYNVPVRTLLDRTPKAVVKKKTGKSAMQSMMENVGMEYEGEEKEKEDYVPPAMASMFKKVGMEPGGTKPATEEQDGRFFANFLESVKLTGLQMASNLGGTAEMLGKQDEAVNEKLASFKESRTGAPEARPAPTLTESGEVMAGYFDKKIKEKEHLQAPSTMGKWEDPVFYARNLGSLVPQLGGALLTAVTTGPAGVVAFGYSQEAGSAYKEAKELGATDEKAIELGNKVGMLNGSLEMIGVEAAINKLPGFKQFKKRISSSFISKMVKDSKAGKVLSKVDSKIPVPVKGITAAGVPEGATEMMQEVVSNIVLEELDKNRNWYDGLAESGVFGFIGGATIGGRTQTKAIKRDNAAKAQPTKEVKKDTKVKQVIKTKEEAKAETAKLRTATAEQKRLVTDVARARKNVDKIEANSPKSPTREQTQDYEAKRLTLHRELAQKEANLSKFEKSQVGRYLNDPKTSPRASQRQIRGTQKATKGGKQEFGTFLKDRFGTNEKVQKPAKKTTKVDAGEVSAMAKSAGIKTQSPRETTQRQYDNIPTVLNMTVKGQKTSETITPTERKIGLKAKDAANIEKDIQASLPENKTLYQKAVKKANRVSDVGNTILSNALERLATKAGMKKFIGAINNTVLKDKADGKMSIANRAAKKVVYGYRHSEAFKEATARKIRGENVGVEIAEDIHTLLTRDLDDAQRREVHKAILNNGKHEDAGIAKKAKEARKVLDSIAIEFAKAGGISLETANKNIGKYMARLYYRHEIANKVSDYFKIGGAKKDFTRGMAKGIVKKVATSQVGKYVADGWTDRGAIKTNPNYSRIWRDYTPDERLKRGEIVNNPGYLVSKGVIQTTSAIATDKFFTEVSKMKDYVKNESFADWKQIPDTKEYGDLRGKFLSPYVYEDIKGVVENQKYGDKIAQKALTMWKKSKVVYNPASISRNVAFNFILSDFAGLSPLNTTVYNNARKIAWDGAFGKEKNELYSFMKREGLFGGSYIGQDLNKEVRKTAKLEPGVTSDVEGNTAMEMLDNMQEKFGKTDENVGAFYQFTEEWNKTALFLYAREQGMTDKEAVIYAKKWGLDYSAVTPAMVKLSRHLLGSPFIRFNVLVAPRLVEGIIKRPFAALKYGAMYTGMKTASLGALGLTDDEWDDAMEEALPAWMDNRILVPLPYKIDGKYQAFDVNNLVPFSNEDFNPAKMLETLFLQNPLIGAIKSTTGTDPFTGRGLWDEDADPTAMEKGFALAAYNWQNLVPSLAPGNYGWRKMQNAITDTVLEKQDKLPAREKRGTIATSVANSLFGINVRELDIPKQISYRAYELEKQYSHQKKRYSKTYTDPRMSDREIKNTRENSMERMRKIIESRNRLYKISPELRQ